ncbi:MAG: hypothetical protein ACFFKA_18615, partial [Candidatus Thorarchaeota archaeon]
MLSKIKKPKKEKDIRVRYTEKEKAKIYEFVSNSNFENVSRYFRYLDINYRNGLLIEKYRVQQEDNISIEEISNLKKSLKIQEEKSDAVRNRINQLYELLSNEKGIEISMNLKSSILKLLEKAKYTPQEIATILNIEEHLVYNCLAELIQSRLIDFNN